MAKPGKTLLGTATETCKCLCEDDQLAVARPRLRVGTTPGLRDEPVNNLLHTRRYIDWPAASIEWVQTPTDMDAVSAMVQAGLVDVAMTFSEDAAMQVASNRMLRVCGTFSVASRRWQVLVPAPFARSGGEIRGQCPVGAPASLCAEVAAAVLEERDVFGWRDSPPVLLPQESLQHALHALLANRTVKALLWECTAMQLRNMSSACSVIHEVSLPFPSHTFLASRETLQAKMATIKSFLGHTRGMIGGMKDGEDRQDSLLIYMMDRYAMTTEEAKSWAGFTSWSCSCDVEWPAVAKPLEYLRRLGLLPRDTFGADEPKLPRRYLAPRCRVLGGPAPSPDDEESDGDSLTLGDNSSHHSPPQQPPPESRPQAASPAGAAAKRTPSSPWSAGWQKWASPDALAAPDDEDVPCDPHDHAAASLPGVRSLHLMPAHTEGLRVSAAPAGGEQDAGCSCGPTFAIPGGKMRGGEAPIGTSPGIHLDVSDAETHMTPPPAG